MFRACLQCFRASGEWDNLLHLLAVKVLRAWGLRGSYLELCDHDRPVTGLTPQLVLAKPLRELIVADEGMVWPPPPKETRGPARGRGQRGRGRVGAAAANGEQPALEDGSAGDDAITDISTGEGEREPMWRTMAPCPGMVWLTPPSRATQITICVI